MLVKRPILLLSCVGCLVACSSAPAGPAGKEPEPVARQREGIVDPTGIAISHPEAVIFGAGDAWCSGALIDATTVLTAGHCLNEQTVALLNDDDPSNQLAFPYAGQVPRQTVTGFSVWTDGDLGIIKLQAPGVQIDVYPALPIGDLSVGTPLNILGAICNGDATTDAVWERDNVSIMEADGIEYVMDDSVSQPGDSGGPNELPPLPYNCTVGLGTNSCSAPCTWDPNTNQCVPPPPPPPQIRAVTGGNLVYPNGVSFTYSVRTDTSEANAWIAQWM